MTKRLIGLAVGAVLVALCGACTATLTPDGTPYTITNPSPGTVIVSASITTGSNNRELVWSQTSPWESTSSACATFASGQGEDQQGIALRINNGHAIEVERNIWAAAYNHFVFVDWTGHGALTIFGDVDDPSLPVAPATYPLTMCASIVGSVVSFTIDGSPMGSATAPATAPTVGQAGLYVGHVVPGTSTTFSGVTVDGATPTGLTS